MADVLVKLPVVNLTSIVETHSNLYGGWLRRVSEDRFGGSEEGREDEE